MAVDFWKANDEVHDLMMELVANHHPDLALVVEEIVVVFREKAGKTGGRVVLGSPSKVSAKANAMADTEYKFMLEIAADQWEHNLTSKQREALLDSLLCACRCEEDPKSGEIKCTVAKPDIMAFRENIDRYGMWFPKDDDDVEDEDVSPVEDMFGADAK